MSMLLGSLLWLLAVLLLARATPTLARRLLPAERWPFSELFLRSLLLAAALIVVLSAAAGLLGALGRWTLLAALVLVAALAERLRARHADRPRPASTRTLSWRGSAFPFAIGGALVALDSALALQAPPTSWDAMAYHLYFPARWLQEGRIFHIPTVFFDNVAAYAPQNGALLHGWQMALSGSDATTTAAQGLLILFAATALYRLALELGARRHAAALVAAPATLLVPVRHWAYTANVDVYMAAFAVGAVYWTVVFLRRDEAGSAGAAALAAGLAAGTKTAGLVLAAPLLLVLGVALVLRRRLHVLAIVAPLPLLAGGFWYLRNWLLYGNPLFPLDFSLGPLHFAGVYRSEALRQSFLHVDWPAWTRTVDLLVGRAVWVSALFGTLLLLFAAKRSHRLPAAGIAVFGIAWAYFCYAVQPYNNQVRFLIPALWLSLIGLALFLDRIRGRLPRTLLGLGLALVFLLTTTPLASARLRLGKLYAAGADLATFFAAALLPLLLFALLRKSTRRRAALPWMLAIASWPLLLAAFITCERTRPHYYAETDFKVYAAGYLPFSDPELEPQRIAYSGFSTPYVLMGSGWRHRVRYLETPADAGEGLYDYWRREPRIYASHKPGLYRRADDEPGPWLERLEEQKIDYVALFAPFPVELPAHWPMDGRFLVERRWIRQHPNARPIVETPVAEVYRIER